ncbi:MAG: hypothetical protein E7554_03575 [Ruminococcaceae bacterium]|nr:hypothetical protein [Oscillospiraceae bacterium]
MKSNIKDKITAIGFTAVLAAVLLLNIILPDQDKSVGERRALAKMPKLTFSSVIEGDYFEDLEDYAMDQFLLRDTFRAVKSSVRLNVFMQMESNDLFIHDGHIFKLSPEVNADAVSFNCRKVLEAAKKYWPDAKMYYSIVPEKNTFLDSSAYPGFDSELYNSTVAQALPGVQNIVIDDLLSINDYYLTDPHWRQEKVIDVADRLLSVMGNPVNDPAAFAENTACSFYGTYHGQLPLNVDEDELVYLTGDRIDGAEVIDCETLRPDDLNGSPVDVEAMLALIEAGKSIDVYSPEKLEGMDPYDMYLGGARALLKIYNPAGTPGRELVIFRDSFGSSIAPLLISDYETVTLVDLRYVAADVLETYVSAAEQTDVLFLYSQTILNNNGVFR